MDPRVAPVHVDGLFRNRFESLLLERGLDSLNLQLLGLSPRTRVKTALPRSSCHRRPTGARTVSRGPLALLSALPLHAHLAGGARCVERWPCALGPATDSGRESCFCLFSQCSRQRRALVIEEPCGSAQFVIGMPAGEHPGTVARASGLRAQRPTHPKRENTSARAFHAARCIGLHSQKFALEFWPVARSHVNARPRDALHVA